MKSIKYFLCSFFLLGHYPRLQVKLNKTTNSVQFDTVCSICGKSLKTREIHRDE